MTEAYRANWKDQKKKKKKKKCRLRENLILTWEHEKLAKPDLKRCRKIKSEFKEVKGYDLGIPRASFPILAYFSAKPLKSNGHTR